MKATTLLTALSLSGAAELVQGHYIFQQFGVGSTKFAVYEHIRKNTNYNSPVTSLTSNDLRCNVGGGSGASTTVANVKAGDSFTFRADQAVYHQGPISLYVTCVSNPSANKALSSPCSLSSFHLYRSLLLLLE